MLPSGVFLPVLQVLASPLQGFFGPAILAAILLSLLIVILYYLFAKFLSSPQLEAFAREEFSQFVFTMLIFASFPLLSFLVSQVVSAAACDGASCSFIDVALYSLGVVQGALAEIYFSLYSYELTIGILSTMGFHVPIFVTPALLVWISISTFSGLEPVSNALITIIESMGYLFALAYGREMLVYFFRDVAFTILLPLGFAMRAMPFSRRTGSSLIAIAFAGYFAYPLSIILSHSMMLENMEAKGMEIVNAQPTPVFCNPPCDLNTPECQDYIQMANKKIGSDWAEAIEDLTEERESFWELIFGGLFDVVISFVRFFGELYYAFLMRYNYNLISPTFAPFVHFAYFFVISKILSLVQFAVLVLITFVFEIIITVTAFRSLSFVLGGEIEILGLTKVV